MLYIAAGTILLLGIFTPINVFLTLVIAGLLALGAYKADQVQKTGAGADILPDEEMDHDEMKSPESVISLLSIDPIEFEFGYGLIPLADTNQGGDLLDRVVMIRRQLAIELGLVIPVVRIRDNIQLKPNEYRLKIKGTEMARGELLLDHYLAMAPGMDDESVEGIEPVEPSFGLPAKWITEDMKEYAEMLGYTVVDPPSVVSTHITEVIKANASELIGRQETKHLIEHLRESAPILVEEVTPNPLTVGDIQKVLAKLLKEKVSIRNLPIIFETLADFGRISHDPEVLTEYVRQALARQITSQYVTGESLKVITLSGRTEKAIADSVQQTEHGSYLTIDPDSSQKIVQSIGTKLEENALLDQLPVLLCSPAVRMYVRQLTDRYFPQLPVLSYNELEANVEVQAIGVVNME